MSTEASTNAIAIYPIQFVFSPNTNNAKIIEKIISPIDKRELSAAVVNLRPMKNMAGAIAAPQIDVINNRIRSLPLIGYFTCFATGVMARPEIKYTKEASIRGFTFDTIGFAIVETDPKSKAPIIAEI